MLPRAETIGQLEAAERLCRLDLSLHLGWEIGRASAALKSFLFLFRHGWKTALVDFRNLYMQGGEDITSHIVLPTVSIEPTLTSQRYESSLANMKYLCLSNTGDKPRVCLFPILPESS